MNTQFHIKHFHRIPCTWKWNTTPVLISSDSSSVPLRHLTGCIPVSPSYNSARLFEDEGTGSGFPFCFALFKLLFFLFQVLVTSHSFSERVSHFQSVLQIIHQSASHIAVIVLHPLMIPCSFPDQACVPVCCVLRHSAICHHLTYLVQQIHFQCSGYAFNKIRLRRPHCLEKDDSKPLSTLWTCCAPMLQSCVTFCDPHGL